MLNEKYFNVNFWKGIKFLLYLGVFILSESWKLLLLYFSMTIRGITGSSTFITPYVPNQHAGIWDLRLFTRNCEPLQLILNIVEKSTEEFNSIRDLIPLKSDVRREDAV